MSGPAETRFATIGFDVQGFNKGNIAATGATEALTGRPTLFQQQTVSNVGVRQWRWWRGNQRGGGWRDYRARGGSSSSGTTNRAGRNDGCSLRMTSTP